MTVARMLLAIPLIIGICGCSGERPTDVAPGDVDIADADPVSPTENAEWVFQWESQYAEGTPADVVLTDDVHAWQATVSRMGGYTHRVSGE